MVSSCGSGHTNWGLKTYQLEYQLAAYPGAWETVGTLKVLRIFLIVIFWVVTDAGTGIYNYYIYILVHS